MSRMTGNLELAGIRRADMEVIDGRICDGDHGSHKFA